MHEDDPDEPEIMTQFVAVNVLGIFAIMRIPNLRFPAYTSVLAEADQATAKSIWCMNPYLLVSTSYKQASGKPGWTQELLLSQSDNNNMVLWLLWALF